MGQTSVYWKHDLLILEKILCLARETGTKADALKYSKLSKISSGLFVQFDALSEIRTPPRPLQTLLKSLSHNTQQENPGLFNQPH